MTRHECRSNLAVPMIAWALGTALVALPLRAWQWAVRRSR